LEDQYEYSNLVLTQHRIIHEIKKIRKPFQTTTVEVKLQSQLTGTTAFSVNELARREQHNNHKITNKQNRETHG